MRYERMCYDDGTLVVYDTETGCTEKIKAGTRLRAQVVVGIKNLVARVEKYSPAVAELLDIELTAMLEGWSQ
jgi:hypothetical protein